MLWKENGKKLLAVIQREFHFIVKRRYEYNFVGYSVSFCGSTAITHMSFFTVCNIDRLLCSRLHKSCDLVASQSVATAVTPLFWNVYRPVCITHMKCGPNIHAISQCTLARSRPSHICNKLEAYRHWNGLFCAYVPLRIYSATAYQNT